ncbi:hypothetical protein, partial [Ectopseudomonas khazarica]|uniref:hypothetical protein n=1 Tax=Ectopseudomonas khazarica TaxID=2502979 RepID=UPI003A8FF388
CGLFGVQRLGHDTLSGTLCYVFAIGFKHSYYPHQWSQRVVRDAIQILTNQALFDFMSRSAEIA